MFLHKQFKIVLRFFPRERFKKYYGRSERGFFGFGEALAKEHVRSDLRLSRNDDKTKKDRSAFFFLSEWP